MVLTSRKPDRQVGSLKLNYVLQTGASWANISKVIAFVIPHFKFAVSVSQKTHLICQFYRQFALA